MVVVVKKQDGRLKVLEVCWRWVGGGLDGLVCSVVT